MSPRVHHSGLITALALACLAGASVRADEAAASGAASGPVADKPSLMKEPAPPRLRFRSGPVCMCAGGLSEAEIREAEEKRTNNPERDPAQAGGVLTDH